MNDSFRQRRIERSSQLFQRFNDRNLPRLPFQDEKDSTVNIKTNHQNHRVYSKGWKCDFDPGRLFNERNKLFVKVMLLAAITWKGITGLIFFGSEGLKINGSLHFKLLQNEMIPPLEDLFPNNDFILI